MNYKKIKARIALFLVFNLVVTSLVAQVPTTFVRVGNQSENVQDLFPGTHRARPVMADFTNNGYMDIFYGGQDIGGSTGWYLKDINKDNRWGDQGDGTFVNPVLNADYSDPDVIRVGEKYYMVCSDFHFIGIPMLESEDMVNWKIISQVYDRFDFPEWENNSRYGGGAWAPALRYHDGKYWVYFCTPDEGLFMSNATDPRGPWSPLLNVKHISGWEDPCPFWDEDGQAYLGRSQLGGGPIILHKMSPDGTRLLDNGKKVYEGPVAEGTKIFKKDGYYYMSIPEGGVSTGWQTILRSKNIYGPYKKKIVLEQGTTKINGPHQGALVDTPSGEWWFYHFQGTDPLGRVVHLQPVSWKEGWPFVGVDKDGNGIGEPVKQWKKPDINVASKTVAPQTDDDFSSTRLGLQWQFNHNPVNDKWSLTERPGYLTIKALKADKLRSARNMFTQKHMGYEGVSTTEINCSGLANGQRAGLSCVGNKYNAIGVERVNDQNYIYVEFDGVSRRITAVSSETLWFRVTLDANYNEHQFYYSLDNNDYIACEDAYELRSSDWKGARVGIYSYNTLDNTGEAYFNWFTYKFDGPGNYQHPPRDPEPVKYADWHVWNEMAALIKNNGDHSFTLMQEYDLDIATTIWTNAVFFDYDNDGNPDLFIVGKGGDWRITSEKKFARLYRNSGKEGNYMFEEVMNTGIHQYCDELYINTISIGDYNNDGYNDIFVMCHDGKKGSVDLYKNNNGDGTFSLQAGAVDRGASKGSVMFGDIDNDGWLDIFFAGTDSGASSYGIYKNNQDGTFTDITSDFDLEIGTESQSVLADINGDGMLDMMVTGQSGFRTLASLYRNTIDADTGKRKFILHNSRETGITPVSDANILVADFNNDGLMDMIINGKSTNNRTQIYYQKTEGNFIPDTTYPLVSIRNGGINMGDINGDGNMDIIIGGYKSIPDTDTYPSPVRIYENHPEAAGLRTNLPPSAPSFVEAVYENGRLRIRWEEARDDISPSSALRYNIFVRNEDTGKIWMMLPADVHTGQIKVGTDLQTSLSSLVTEYSMVISESGNYTIGVQALDQAYAGSSFTTINKYITTNIAQNTCRSRYSLQNMQEGIIIYSKNAENVTIINPEGNQVTNGITNRLIPLYNKGLFIALVGTEAIKIMRA